MRRRIFDTDCVIDHRIRKLMRWTRHATGYETGLPRRQTPTCKPPSPLRSLPTSVASAANQTPIFSLVENSLGNYFGHPQISLACSKPSRTPEDTHKLINNPCGRNDLFRSMYGLLTTHLQELCPSFRWVMSYLLSPRRYVALWTLATLHSRASGAMPTATSRQLDLWVSAFV